MGKRMQIQLIELAAKKGGQYIIISDGSTVAWYFNNSNDPRVNIVHATDKKVLGYSTNDVNKLFNIFNTYNVDNVLDKRLSKILKAQRLLINKNRKEIILHNMTK